MIPTWTVYEDEDGKLIAYWEWDDKIPVDRDRIRGYVSCKDPKDAIRYTEEVLM